MAEVQIYIGKNEITILDTSSFGVVMGQNLVDVLKRELGNDSQIFNYIVSEYDWVMENCFVKEDCIVASVECRYNLPEKSDDHCYHYECTKRRYEDRDDMEGIELDYQLNYISTQTIDAEERLLESIQRFRAFI